ncbi:MAG TPA: ATP-binding cassette domain-containing protein [bacterium]|nr:ATP-binding cassette domain-containing protein [bacterium]
MTESAVIVNHLSKQYGKNSLAIQDISFTAAAGEILGLLGPNGAGKTTTIRVLSTVLSPTSGEAHICGCDIRTEAEAVRRKIGVLTTDVGAYERFTGRENLAYFGTLYGLTSSRLSDRIMELAQLLDMEAFIDKKAGTYSTGMKQKLAIARSVIHDPEVVIFDEPTAGLDVLASQTVLSYMQKACELGKCVIFSTHQMLDAEKLCQRVAIIHGGKLIAFDTVSALKETTGGKDLEEVFLSLIKQNNAIGYSA